MTDRIYANALTPDGNRSDLATRDGRFVPVETAAPDARRIDLDGLTVLPAFVEGHIHLDKSFVGDAWHPHQPADTLRERLAVEKRLLASALPVTDRAEALLAQAHAFGTVAMRSHVDVDPVLGLDSLHAVAAACEKWKGRVDVELVAFPQAGIVSNPGTADLLDAAMREGATVMGGLDPTEFDGDAEAHLDIVFGTAGRHGSKIDIHLHEHGAGGIEQIERIAARTTAAGMAGLVTISHAYALGDVGLDQARRVAAALAEAGVAIMTNAPGDHPFPPVAVLRAEGVCVFAGNDNIRDAWWPYGNGDLLERAMMIGYRSGLNTDEELGHALDMITVDAARALGRPVPGFAVGDEASFVIVDAPNAAAAVASPSSERVLVQRGEIVPRSRPSIHSRLA
ncbi:amidohydrolase [Chachezhania sediminis]|uniref:amidohydrolase n=1 Tax=Chachezhania sediminis TaxID=2599291 RepID=UPI00131AD898|nr:amidohydrolase [Chachezhania sediminis]